MEKNKRGNDRCVVGVAPSSRGFGFAVMRKGNTLADWGIKTVKSGKKNEKCLARFIELIEQYKPIAIMVEDCSNSSKRRARTKLLIAEFIAVAKEEKINVHQLSRKAIKLHILEAEDGTKHDIARYLSSAFSEQLGFRLPVKRRLWTNEPYQMDIFDAVALAQCYWVHR